MRFVNLIIIVGSIIFSCFLLQNIFPDKIRERIEEIWSDKLNEWLDYLFPPKK